MRMTEVQLIEAENAKMRERLQKLGLKRRKPAPSPTAKALREAAVLQEANDKKKRERTLAETLDRIRGGGDHGSAPALALAEARLAGRVEHGPAAAHAIVAARLRGDRAPLEAHRLVEAIRNRSGQSAPAGDLHQRLKKAVTR